MTASEFSLTHEQLEKLAVEIYADNDPYKVPFLWKSPKFKEKDSMLVMEKDIEFKNGHLGIFADFEQLCENQGGKFRTLHNGRFGDHDAVCESSDYSIVHFYIYLNPTRCYGKDCFYAAPKLIAPIESKRTAFMNYLISEGYKTKAEMDKEKQITTERNMREGQAALHAELDYTAVRTRGTKVCRKDKTSPITAHVDDVAEDNIRLMTSDGKVFWDSPFNWTRCL